MTNDDCAWVRDRAPFFILPVHVGAPVSVTLGGWMNLEIEVWLRGEDVASTQTVSAAMAEPAAWTDNDVRVLLEELLRAIDRGKNPDADRHRPVWLRGFSWIVSPFDGGGVTLAVEIKLGAAAAGPFAIDQRQLEDMVTRVVRDAAARPSAPASIH